MAKKYDNDFKLTIVQLLMAGRKAKEVSHEYGLTENTIRRWRREFDSKQGDFSKKKILSDPELEVKQLRKEMAEVKMERDILKKALSIFSKTDR
tara:strand:- start:485 stop:766 length:282 start_codon:yes stop_codon:yes gene_type:complete